MKAGLGKKMVEGDDLVCKMLAIKACRTKLGYKNTKNKHKQTKLGRAVHAFNPSAREAQKGGCLGFLDYFK